jgi:DNA invertase Pin-like site-specific DNA recombinase
LPLFFPEKPMSTRRRLAISYSRFSDPKQAHGDSEDRQERMFRDFCERHNLTPLTEVFADRGRSGYKDEHRKKGRLGQLIALAKDERFEPGTVIVVEAWDRLGRLRPDRQTDLVAELLRTGVSIGVCRLNDIFSEEDFGSHKWTTLAVFIQLAFQESKQKAERVAASWDKRRERAREQGQLLCRRLPAWMEYIGDKHNGAARLIPERVAAVKRIFQLAADGHGHTRIVKTLHKEGIQPFGEVRVTEGRSRSQFSGKWTRPYIRLILNDRRALGELQPRKADGSPDGSALVNYFPAVISEEEFLLARAGQAGRQSNGNPPGIRQSRYVNVFKGLLTHARDGEGFLLHNKGTAARPELILVNAKGNGGRDKCYTFPYPIFEEAVLGLLRELDPRQILPKDAEAPSRLDVLRAKLDNLRQDIAKIQEDLRDGYSKALVEVLRTQEAAEETVATELQEELVKTIKPAAKAWKELPSLIDVIRSAADPEAVRLKLRLLLRQLVTEGVVLIVRRGSFQIALVRFHFTGGASRDYLLIYQPKANRRAGGWSARSFATRKPADLHKRTDLRRLEKELLDADDYQVTPSPRKDSA